MEKRYNINKGIGLVLEGGGLRGMFTNGVIDVLMDNGITLDGLVGVSAGVLFGCNYKSMQPRRALRYNITYKDDKDYMSWKSWFATGNYVNEDFAFRQIPYYLDPFDFDAFATNPMPFFAVCTDIVNGKPVYHQIKDARGKGMQWMRASSSMPVFGKPVCIDGHVYLDGGITDSIPLEFMQRQGYQKNIVVLTQPLGFRKKKAHVKLPLKIMLHNYPKVADLMSVRHIMYNKELDFVIGQEAAGKTLVISPDTKLDIGRLDLNETKMKSIYLAGVAKAKELMPQIIKFLH